MKKQMFRVFVAIGILLFTIASFIGCGNIKEASSQGEAIYAASQLPDFDKLIEAKSINSAVGLISRGDGGVCFLNSGDSFVIIHFIVYKKKDGETGVVYYDDKRPPKQISK